MKINTPAYTCKKICEHKVAIVLVLVLIFISSSFLILDKDRLEEEYENTLASSVYGTQFDTPMIYNGEVQTGFASSDWYTLSGDVSAVEAGEYTVIATLVDPTNTSWPDGTTEPKEIVWSIAKAQLQILVDDYSILYGDEAPSYTYAYNGFMLGDNASNSVIGEITLDCTYSEGDSAGEYCISASGLQSSNYEIMYEKGTLFVIEKTIDLPVANEGLVYSGFEMIGVPTGRGYSLSNNIGKDAGEYTAIASLTDNVNTTWPDSTNEPIEIIWAIERAPLTVTVSDIEITFGEIVPEYVCICYGFTSEDDDTLTIDDIVYECVYSKDDPVGEYVISASGLFFPNYEIIYLDGTLTVKKRTVQIPEVKFDLSYNGAIQNGILTGSGYEVINNEGLTPGIYQSSVVLVDSKNTMWSDGTIDDRIIEWMIEKAPLTVTAEDKSVEFGGDIPEYTCTFIGLISGDFEYLTFFESIIFNCEYGKTSLPGDYVISLSGIISSNYNVTYENGILTVVEKIIGLPIIIENPIYNGIDITGVLEGSGYTIRGNIGRDAGSYTAIATLIDSENTKWADLETDPKTISWIISKAPLSVIIGDSQIVFGDDAPIYDFGYSGFVPGDNNTSVTGNIEFECEYITRSNVGNYVITASGLESSNYAISYVNGTLTVNKKIINLPVAITGLVYNGEEQMGIEPGEDYISIGDRAMNAGTYGAFVTLNSDTTTSWEDGTTEGRAINWNIAPKPISSEMIAPICTQICAGAPVEPVVVNDDMNELRRGADYTVSYENNTSEGIATAVISGIGNYTGTIHTMFDVLLGYLVEYDLNGFMGTAPKSQALAPGSVIDLTSIAAPLRAGYTFIGWSLSSVGEAITEHTVTENVKLYALWNNSDISSANLIAGDEDDDYSIIIAMVVIAVIDISLIYLIFIRRI